MEYTADDLTGFNAVVKRLGPNIHTTTIPHGKTLPYIPLTPIAPLAPLSYGWGAAPSAIGLPKTTIGHWSLPWDPLTSSYGGWVPLKGSSLGGPYATIYSKRYAKNGKLLKSWTTGPIPLHGGSLVIKTKH